MAYRSELSILVFALAAIGCQRLPEDPDDDDGPVTSATDGSTGEGSFLLVSSEGGPGNDEESESDCDPVSQTGCSPGEKCTAQKDGSSIVYTCVSSSPTTDPFGSCTPALTGGDDGCPAGYVCLGTEMQGTCVALCLGDSDCNGDVCGPDPFDFVDYCSGTCSPFESACPTPLQCRRVDDRFACMFNRPEDVGVLGDPCDTDDDAGCAPGFACIPGGLVPGCENPACCTSLCDLSGADPCPNPATCAGAIETPAPGFENVGACFVPA